ncbi:nicotinate phosphoribosyltransferase [Pseudoleptotrichia goodfellowii]|uniref:Nicotinate phosphoribosyltransferase n=2 Tax=Pseudoleptotrichia goodfellowii TaxID=157692 RepID=A0A510J8T9_9FUSO|nr:nicotinate phosphoribosyltransferase [Pseudoleptotrichia goodfellowii]
MLMDKFFKFLNSDRYQYTESEIYLKNNMENQIAVFDIFLRTEKEKDYAIVYGISDVLELIDILNSTSYEEKKKYLSKILKNEDLTEYIANMKFTGSVKGVRDGETVFTDEPILTIIAPLIQGKILETPILNILNYQILTATVTSKITLAAKDKEVLFFGTRRVPGFEASMAMTKASYIAGCISHSNIMGEYFYDLKSTGTMTHGYVQSFGTEKDSEYRAFDTFIKTCKDEKLPLIMLTDTYSVLKSGIHSAIRAFRDNNINDDYEGIYGIRIDSGNLLNLSKKCREILDDEGFRKAKIILTGGIDEGKIRRLMKQGVQADMFGVGDAIALPKKEISTVYKMSRIEQTDVMKISDDKGKMSYPGDKEIYRTYKNNNFFDVVTLKDEKEEMEILKKEKYRKLTLDFIIDGEKIEENIELLGLTETKRYYENNVFYLKEIYNETQKRKRIRFSKGIKKLKEELTKF